MMSMNRHTRLCIRNISRSKSSTTAATVVSKKAPTKSSHDGETNSRIYKDKPLYEIARAYTVFKLCKFDYLVKNNEKLMKLGRSALGDKLFDQVMKMSFYGHFVGGECEDGLKPVIEMLEKNGIGAILDYAVEKDISKDEATTAEILSTTPENQNPDELDRLRADEGRFVAHRMFGDRREEVFSAKTYFYQDEHQCDQNVDIFLRCIEVASKCSNNGFAAIKLTSLGRPQFLLQLSDVLTQTRTFFDRLTNNYPGDILLRDVSQKKFVSGLNSMGVLMTKDEANQWFSWLDSNQDGTFNVLDWNQLLDKEKKLSRVFVSPDPKTGEIKPLIDPLTEREEEQMQNMLGRMDILAKAAESLGVNLMIDAEQTYFQPAINRLVLELMRHYNKRTPVIFNTHQCYLKESFNNFVIDFNFAQTEGFHFGTKLVRGAYMNQERKRAKEIGYSDPINPTYEATNRMYERVVGECLNSISAGNQLSIMVASHNEDSINFTTERMHQLGLPPDDGKIYFGQLLGMCDRLSFQLGHKGYLVNKYVPFGPVQEVLPYLSRRAYENSSMLASTGKEVSLLKEEIFARAFRR